MKNWLKITVWIVFATVLVLLSFDVQNLDEYRKENQTDTFNAEAYTSDIWINKMPAVLKNAPDITDLIVFLEQNKARTIQEYGHKLGISKTVYFTVKGVGEVVDIQQDNVVLKLAEDRNILVATDFIFGNAVRDGLGIVHIDDFLNMTDFNSVSIALNNRVKNNVIPALKETVKTGMQLEFYGALELNEHNPDLYAIRVIPLEIKGVDGK